MALWQLFFLAIFVGQSYAFRTNPFEYPEDSTSLTHGQITRAGLWLSLIDFLIENPNWVNDAALPENNTDELVEQIRKELSRGILNERLSYLILASKFPAAVQEIVDANVLVESQESYVPESHFYNEKLVKGSRRLVSIKKRILLLMNEGSYEQARRETGRYLHTLQDFYSNSNWVEFRNKYPLETLGDNLIPKWYVAKPNETVCKSCTPIENFKDSHQVDDCFWNILHTVKKLTTGYRFNKPKKSEKCSHGGVNDGTRHNPATGGINKESHVRALSPHYYLHNEASRLAIEATKHFFNDLREEVNDTKFAEFFNMEVGFTLSFVIDTSGSMSDEINLVKRTTIAIINEYSRNGEKIYYTLSPFSDPEVGPIFSTTDPEEAKAKVLAISPDGGGDCPEYSMQGLYLALTHSLPDSLLFLFTDAGAKDREWEPAVLALAKQKQCVIDPVLTGEGICSSKRRKKRDTSGKSIYERLATATGGQVLEYPKGEISKVVEVIKSEIVNSSSTTPLHKVTLLNIQRQNSAHRYRFHVQCDSSVISLVVLLSAASAVNIRVKPPTGLGDRGVSKKDTDKIYRVIIKAPQKGNWTFIVTATGPYSLKVTAQATLALKTSLFVKKYLSEGEQSSLVPLTDNPVQGRQLYVAVTPSLGNILKKNATITAYMDQVSGQGLGSFILKPGKDLYSNLYYGNFIPHTNAFRLRLVGYSDANEIIERVVSQLIEPQVFEITVSKGAVTVLHPGEPSVVIVILHNYGASASFDIEISDDQSFVNSSRSFTMKVNGNTSVNINVTLRAELGTKDGTTSSVSVSAKVSGAGEDTFNAFVFRVSVFSKEFEYLNETAIIISDLDSFLVPVTPSKTTPRPCTLLDCCCGAMCEVNETNHAVCRCPETCGLVHRPLCASNNETYENDCLLARAACRYEDPYLVKVSNGPCNKDVKNTTPKIINQSHKYSDDIDKLPFYVIGLITAGSVLCSCIFAAVVYVLYRNHMLRKVGLHAKKEHEMTIVSSRGKLSMIA